MTGGVMRAERGYKTFTDYLRRQTATSIALTFDQIQRIIGMELPPTAFRWEAYWSNSTSHPLAAAWLEAGWRRPRGGLSLTGRQVTLERVAPLSTRSVEADGDCRQATDPAASALQPVTDLSDDWHDLASGALDIVLEVERDSDGSVLRFEPQGDYENEKGLPLNRYGTGSFCRFRVPGDIHRAGVYLIVADGRLAYVGECDDFSRRFNTGYGQISPRNCFAGGQETNCRVNQLILRCAESGSDVHVYFVESEDRFALERACIRVLEPPWNGRR